MSISPATEFNAYHHPMRQGLRVPSPHATGVACAITPRDGGCVYHHPTRRGLRVPSPHATGACVCHHPTRRGLRVPSPHATGVACAITPNDKGYMCYHPIARQATEIATRQPGLTLLHITHPVMPYLLGLWDEQNLHSILNHHDLRFIH